MNKYKEIFNKLKEITDTYLLVRGCAEIVKLECGSFWIKKFFLYETTGNYDDDLMEQRFDCSYASFEELDKLEKEGHYKFEALLSYSEAQIGDYPPPNVEVPAYYDLDYIEFTYQGEFVEDDEINDKIDSEVNKDDLPF